MSESTVQFTPTRVDQTNPGAVVLGVIDPAGVIHAFTPEQGSTHTLATRQVGKDGWWRLTFDGGRQSEHLGSELLAVTIDPADEERDGYNTVILEEALSFQSANAEEGEPDTELDAQIEIVGALWAAGDKGGTDHAVDHLRGMLEISYTESYTLDASTELVGAPATRGPAATPEPGAANEVFEIRFEWTRAQIDAIYQGLSTIAEYSHNSAEERAVAILLGAIPRAAFENEGKY